MSIDQITPAMLGDVRDTFGKTPAGVYTAELGSEPKVKTLEPDQETGLAKYAVSFGFKIISPLEKVDSRLTKTFYMPFGENMRDQINQKEFRLMIKALGATDDEYNAMKAEGLGAVAWSGKACNITVQHKEYHPKNSDDPDEKKTAVNWYYSQADAQILV